MMKRLGLVLGIFLFLSTGAQAQSCNGQFAPGQVCGLAGASQGLPSPGLLSPLLDRNFGAPSPQGTVLNRGASVWGSTRSPVLGNPGTNTGTLGLASASGGTATITPPAIAGNTAFQLPTLAGTVPSTATTPILLNSTTGAISCPTCLTGTGGALTAGVTTTSGFTAGQILYSDGSLLQAAGAVKATSIALGGATIGSDGLGVTGSATISGNVNGGAFVPTANVIPTDGMYLNAAGQTAFSAGSTRIFFFNSTGLLMANASGATLTSTAATATGPTVVPRRSDSGTGIGSVGTASLSLIATSIEQLRVNNGSIYVGGAATGSNIAAVAPTISAALSTGNATNPDLVFQTGVKTTSGAGQATATTALTIKGETQQVVMAAAASIGGALTYGGVTLSNSVTGIGSMVLATAPSVSSLTVTTAFTATGLVTNADLVNSSTTVNGQTCTLGSTCTVTAVASSLVVGTTTITSGATTRVLFDNVGVLGEYTISGTGSVAMTTSPVFTTPNIGVATATTINGNTFTTGTYTLTGTAGKTLTFSNSITLAGTDSTTWTGPSTNATLAALNIAGQTLSGGANVTSNNIGTVSSGTTTLNCGTSPLQYLTNNGAFTIAAPAADGSCILRVTNGASAGAITFSGWTVGSNTGDSYLTTNTNKYDLFVRRINGVSSYQWSALQ